MKLVINACFGGYGINEDIAKLYNVNPFCYREDEKLIQVLERGINLDSDTSELKVVEIPDEATDYIIDEYDGYESVIYVLNGKIKRLED